MNKLKSLLVQTSAIVKSAAVTVAKFAVAIFYVGLALGSMKCVNGGSTWKTTF